MCCKSIHPFDILSVLHQLQQQETCFKYASLIPSSFSVDECCLCPSAFKSNQRFSNVLRAMLEFGHFKTLNWFSLNHLSIAFPVCLDLQSCWKLNLHLDLIFWKTQEVFAPSILPLTLTSFPVPVAEKRPYSMMLPSPCVTCMVFSAWVVWYMPDLEFFLTAKKIKLLVSSDNSTFFFKFKESSKCFITTSKLSWIIIFL